MRGIPSEPTDCAGSLTSNNGGNQPGTVDRHGVRRLTERECERLQGLPDDWTLWGANGERIKGGPRYRMIGNAVTVNVAEWIGRRLYLAAAAVEGRIA